MCCLVGSSSAGRCTYSSGARCRSPPCGRDPGARFGPQNNLRIEELLMCPLNHRNLQLCLCVVCYAVSLAWSSDECRVSVRFECNTFWSFYFSLALNTDHLTLFRCRIALPSCGNMRHQPELLLTILQIQGAASSSPCTMKTSGFVLNEPTHSTVLFRHG